MTAARQLNVATAPELIGESAAMENLRALATAVARGDAKVLITGESGVGKDLIARHIHFYSSRRNRAFVAVNCAAFTEALLESELFGHVRGSFTGAYRDKLGKLRLGDGGTVFLDEVGEMSLRMQALLLRFLESGEVQPVGADDAPRTINARIIAATNRNLDELIAVGRFREDLLYRLRVIHVHVPPLRERIDDLPALVRHTLTRTCRNVVFSDEALEAMERYRWPGNVRELQNVVERSSWLPGVTDRVELEHLPEAFRPRPALIAETTRERRRTSPTILYRRPDFPDVRLLGPYPAPVPRARNHQDDRQLLRHGLAATGGNYRAAVTLFGMTDAEYKRFCNFLWP